ncbi:MAG: TetR family transcriptional regulator [Rhodobacteraceae bacterium]|uniref:TetR/AcrR family transcriptional regulator n=1 Tax=Cypionkella sp. TaxID=2811411 RepID=UPI0013288937|nr:TetR/AcrR family transcriptional regulator [Cypionkella sp.]KAF0170773.1 MAG: TetR family transcriptional regulator [Paracoccaceae bacterium]MDO8326344.1 TetR/AcrR family transcriptional regulator [Cypionkella sp.]
MKRGYHHGNLRQALVEAALALIAEQGPTGFTLSEAAKTADVTPAAVYRHFAGRDDLLAEVARQGYDIFAALMEFAYGNGQPTALAAFEATGRAYLAFARKYPGHYMAMFESGLNLQAHPDLAQVAQKARDVVEKAAEKLSQQLPATKRPPASMVSAHIWAMSHGVVELYMRGAPGAKSPFPPEDLLETGIGIYLRGLGLLPPDS